MYVGLLSPRVSSPLNTRLIHLYITRIYVFIALSDGVFMHVRRDGISAFTRVAGYISMYVEHGCSIRQRKRVSFLNEISFEYY